MEELSVAQIKRKRAMYLALSTLSLLFLGLIYAFSMFAAPMSQYFELEKEAVGLTFNIMMITFCIGAVVGSQIEKAMGLRTSLLVAAVMFLVGFAGTGLFAYGNVAMLYLFYGVVAGLGVGIGYNSVIANTNMWFPDKVGFSSGVLMMGFGVSALVLGNIALSLVPAAGLSPVLAVLGVLTFVVVCALAFALSRPPADIVARMCPGSAVAANGVADPAERDAPLKTPTFYVYWVWATIVIAIGLATIGNCASDAQLVGFDAAFATLLVGIVSTFNGFGRVLVGTIYDKTNVKVTMLVDGIVGVCATVCIIGAFSMGVSALYVVGAICCGFCYGGVPVVASAMSRQRFGSKSYPLNLSLANFAIVWGSVLNVIVQTVVGGEARLTIFVVLFVLSILALLDVVPFSKMWNADRRALALRRREEPVESDR